MQYMSVFHLFLQTIGTIRVIRHNVAVNFSHQRIPLCVLIMRQIVDTLDQKMVLRVFATLVY